MGKSNMSERTKNYIGLAIMAVLALLLVFISGPLYRSLSKIGRVKGTESIYTAGTYTGTARGYGGPVTVTLTVTDKDIEKLSATGPDETPSIGGQAVSSMPSRILKQQTVVVDGVAGATYTSNAIKEATEQALALARGESLPEDSNEGISIGEMNLKDGTYTYTADEFDDSGFKDIVSVTIENGAVTECSWDNTDKEGETKSKLSMEGKYVMSETGAPWYKQAEAVADYVISHQGTVSLADSSGYATDTIASVSINISGFLNGLNHCLEQAAK